MIGVFSDHRKNYYPMRRWFYQIILKVDIIFWNFKQWYSIGSICQNYNSVWYLNWVETESRFQFHFLFKICIYQTTWYTLILIYLLYIKFLKAIWKNNSQCDKAKYLKSHLPVFFCLAAADCWSLDFWWPWNGQLLQEVVNII